MKIATITSDDPHHYYLIGLLAKQFEVVTVVIEPGRQRRRRLLTGGHWASYYWSIYHLWRRNLTGRSQYRYRQFAPLIDWRLVNSLPTLKAYWVNSKKVRNHLASIQADIRVICGTSILRSRTLSACQGITLNIHGGFLPDYKGNHCIFFALYEENYDRVGSTIHHVDSSIDGGDIVEVVIPNMYSDDTSESLYCRSDSLAFHRLCRIISDFEQGIPIPRYPQSHSGRMFKMRDRKPCLEIRYWFRRKLGITKIPTIIRR